MKSDYSRYWDMFYQKKKAAGELPLWDVEPERSAGVDAPAFFAHLQNDWGLLDLGCGFGKEALWFAEHFSHVVATDVAPTVIAQAEEMHPHPRIAYGVSDASAPGEGDLVRANHGPLNVYIRAFLHQLKPQAQSVAFENLHAILKDSSAVACITEVAPGIQEYAAAHGGFQVMPRDLQEVFLSHLPPRGVSEERMLELIQGTSLKVLQLESTFLHTRLTFTDGSPVEIPATRCILSASCVLSLDPAT